MMNVKKDTRNTTLFTLHVRSFECAFFSSMPTNSMFRLCISTHPSLMICSVRPVFFQPTTKAWLRTEKMLSIFKISCWTFKHFTAKIAFFFSSIMRSFSASWAFIVTLPRTIFLIVARPRFKFLSANQTGNGKKFFLSPSSAKVTIFRAIFWLTSIAAFWVKILTTHRALNQNSFIFHSLIITINTSLSSIDEDYYKAAVERFDRHKQQQVLEFG
jgi:hypothetical protein